MVSGRSGNLESGGRRRPGGRPKSGQGPDAGARAGCEGHAAKTQVRAGCGSAMAAIGLRRAIEAMAAPTAHTVSSFLVRNSASAVAWTVVMMRSKSVKLRVGK